MHLISLSFTEFSNEVERTNKKAIIAVVTMMCGRKRNHQANLRFLANCRVYMEKLNFMLLSIGLVSCIMSSYAWLKHLPIVFSLNVEIFYDPKSTNSLADVISKSDSTTCA